MNNLLTVKENYLKNKEYLREAAFPLLYFIMNKDKTLKAYVITYALN